MATGKKSKPLTKSGVLDAVTKAHGDEIARKHIRQVIEALVAVGHKELKKTGAFVLHGFAKFVVVKRPARPAPSRRVTWAASVYGSAPTVLNRGHALLGESARMRRESVVQYRRPSSIVGRWCDKVPRLAIGPASG
jgi:nucleoid DNA-binding protein